MPFLHYVGKFYTPTQFDQYCQHQLQMLDWHPQFIVLHNTGTPDIAQRPGGYTEQEIVNLRDFYVNVQGWHGGPHLIVDQKGIWILNDLRYPGVHSPSWNGVAWGVEMLGDFDTDAFNHGDGALIHANAVSALASLSRAAGLDSSTIRFHKEDPNTTHKDCPGANVDKPTVLREVHDKIIALHAAAAGADI